jgi:hypothetical protein
MGVHSYVGIGTIIISTIAVWLYCGNSIAESMNSIAESRNSIAESRKSIAESRNSIAESRKSIAESRNSIAESRKSIAVLKVKNAALTKRLKRVLRSYTVADADKFSAEERRWYVDNCSAYNVHCLLSDVDSSLPTSA